MSSKEDIQRFLAQKTLAFVGLSRDPQSFSSRAYRDLKAKGYRLYPVNPNAASIDGETCFASVRDLPARPGGAIICTPPSETEKVVREAAQAGIGNLWIQQGAESEPALRFCRESGLNAISGHCILMFAEPAGFHGVHRWFKGLFGGLPR